MQKISLVFVTGVVALVSGDISSVHHPVGRHAVPVHHAVPAHHAIPVHHAAPIHHPAHVNHAVPVHHLGQKVGYAPVYPDTHPHYNYGYAVHDDYAGTHFGHSEARDGYKTEGKYFVHLPDGRIQTVTYLADETGYHPTVTYDGAQHGANPIVPHHVPAPAYHASVVPTYHT